MGERAAVGYTREKKVYLKLKLNSYKISRFVGKSTATQLLWDWNM